jgi:hypothetical protein
MLRVKVSDICLGLATHFLVWLAHLFCISTNLIKVLVLRGTISVRRPSAGAVFW